ncbi:MAG: prolyl-tRNA synthetase associated domain-containing protein [Acetobacteraceae bacterium]|nr:prolyl-tRNA synthetase associated domain-containing protein [Acetobacteraceae bacterium]MDW8397474.1 YbaK/EbsC family protein [Acetobacteraceae bacterium]
MPTSISDPPLPPAAADCLARLAAAGIAARTVRHPPVFTVEEARALRGELPGLHVKNLFLSPVKEEGPDLLVTVEETRPLRINPLLRAIGAPRMTMATPERLLRRLGVRPGAVTPLGLVHAPPGSVRVLFDRAILEAEGPVWMHPLDNSASTALSAADLLGFLAALGHRVEPLPDHVG